MARRLLAAAVALAALAASLTEASEATITQSGTLRVNFAGTLKPRSLPRSGLAPVAVSLSGQISTTDRSAPPQLRRITMAINRYGRLNSHGLPRCRYHQIQPASTAEARAACRASLVGRGHFEANVVLPDQSPFPSNGRVLAFNGVRRGRPVIFAHIFGTKPIPTSQLLVFAIHRIEGTFRVVLTANLPQVAADWGYVSGLSLTLRRTFRHRGALRSYLAAGCPAPKGFGAATYRFARASFAFEDGRTLRSTLTRNCRVRRYGARAVRPFSG